MLKFAANLSLLFTELPLLQRFAAAAQAGFGAVEIQFPYDYPADVLAAAASAAGVEVILINVPAGDLMQGGAGLAGHPARQAEFAAVLPQALAYARALGVRMLNVLPGRLAEGVGREQALATLAANLDLAADYFRPHGIRVLCEAINDIDMPGFLLRTADEVAEVLAACNSRDIGMQVDIYHMARMGQDIPVLLATHLPAIAHVQFADAPGRGEPGSGNLPLQQYFALLVQLGYRGWLAAEYRPTRPTAETLGWLPAAAC
ncbi:hydroxypyruvate isomerase family protein [Vogesella sp. LIG4]|uniref:hydroxypyruvate isomerase family protein n=1 Tax=Vogesella sp. LIG4 TaxID=1192162 RepID=UPI00081FB3EF|nr:TIM barrel protein [Vogesella sp. LIG4]SCK27773.1 hydroxypyruvate isomerase [Vogesella sp. LIG4]